MEKTLVAPGPSITYSTYATDNDKAKDQVDDSLASWQYKKADIVDSGKEYGQAGKKGYIFTCQEPEHAFNKL